MLSDLPLIFRERGSGTGLAMERYLEEHQVSVRRKIELTSNEAVKQAVLAGLGYSIMPLIGLGRELANHELQLVKLPDLPIRTHWRLVWLKGKALSPVAAAWLEHLRMHKLQVIDERFAWMRKLAK
jgi:DNA-binding transcriptional LysR family regulator